MMLSTVSSKPFLTGAAARADGVAGASAGFVARTWRSASTWTTATLSATPIKRVTHRDVVMATPDERTSYTIRFRRTVRPSPSSTVQNGQILFEMERVAMRQLPLIRHVRTVSIAAALALLPVSAFAQIG